MKLSVVIASYGLGRGFEECLKSIEKQTMPKKDYEVLVIFVDDSTEVAKSIIKRYRWVKFIKDPAKPGKARNIGIRKSKNKYILFLDDDAITHNKLFERGVSFLERHKNISIVGGVQLTPESDNFFAKTSGAVMASFFGSFNMAYRYAPGRFNLNADENYITTAICFARKDLFDKIKPFVPTLYPGEDTELCERARKNGFGIAYDPNLIVWHKRRPDFKSFAKQFFNYGYVKLQQIESHRYPLSPLFVIPSLLLVYLILFPLLYLISFVFVVPLIVYSIIATSASVITAIKNKNYLGLPLMPFLYLSIHLSYGLGLWSYFIRSKL